LKTFFTSDTHFGHKNVIEFCNRGFSTIEEMDKRLIRNWNERVNSIDTVFFLGDFMFRSANKFSYYRNQLKGDIIFIAGNHDRNNGNRTKINNIVLRMDNKDIFLTHRINDIVLGYDLYLVGHSHEKWKHRILNDGYRNNIIINVGVDVWDYKPITYNEINSYISKL
jgi:calcineurin-like phosphoesterase family protein